MDNLFSVFRAARNADPKPAKVEIALSSPNIRPLFAQSDDALFRATLPSTNSEHEKMTDQIEVKRVEWHPMDSMPLNQMVVVGNRKAWALAKRRTITEWRRKGFWFETYQIDIITYADSFSRRIPFKPTHWKHLVTSFPPSSENDYGFETICRRAGL